MAAESFMTCSKGSEISVHESPCSSTFIGSGGKECLGRIIIANPQMPAPENFPCLRTQSHYSITRCIAHGGIGHLGSRVIPQFFHKAFDILPYNLYGRASGNGIRSRVSLISHRKRNRRSRLDDVTVGRTVCRKTYCILGKLRYQSTFLACRCYQHRCKSEIE